MKNISKIVLGVFLTLSVSGCSIFTTTNEVTGTSEVNNTAKGAAIGATGGAVVGSVAGGAGIAIGVVVGSVGGGYYGYTLDQTQKKLTEELKDMGIEITKEDGAIFVKLKNDILFKKSSDVITDDGIDVLTRFSSIVKQMEGTNEVEIKGYTDNTGTRAFNISLSEQRAKNIAYFLYNDQFPAKQIDYYGFADLNPIADNSTEEGKIKNRRVTIKIKPSVVIE